MNDYVKGEEYWKETFQEFENLVRSNALDDASMADIHSPEFLRIT